MWIDILKHGDEKFCRAIGMAALNDRIAKELGIHLSSNPGQLWFVATEKDFNIGFCSMKTKGNILYLCHDYVYPMNRERGIYRELFSFRDHYIRMHFPSVTLTAVVTKSALPTYLKKGFQITKQSKNFTHVIRTKSN